MKTMNFFHGHFCHLACCLCTLSSTKKIYKICLYKWPQKCNTYLYISVTIIKCIDISSSLWICMWNGWSNPRDFTISLLFIMQTWPSLTKFWISFFIPSKNIFFDPLRCFKEPCVLPSERHETPLIFVYSNMLACIKIFYICTKVYLSFTPNAP